MKSNDSRMYSGVQSSTCKALGSTFSTTRSKVIIRKNVLLCFNDSAPPTGSMCFNALSLTGGAGPWGWSRGQPPSCQVSTSLLRAQCDQVPHCLASMPSLQWWTEYPGMANQNKPFTLNYFLSGVWPEQHKGNWYICHSL